jgi:ubiquinone/menaquinone biosynthesis C-methylase UbiE
MENKYKNINEYLYEDIAIWEKTEGIEFMKSMPLNGNDSPQILDFGFGFGQYLFAAAYAYPKGMLYGIDGSEICIKEVGDKIKKRGITNVKLIGEEVSDLIRFEDNSIDMVLLYDTLHASFSKKKMLLGEAHRVLKKGGCLSVLPFHQGNWRDKDENKKRYSISMIKSEIMEYGFDYVDTCEVKGIHWEKCHTLYYIQKGNITIDMLERMDVMNFISL